MSMLLPQTLSRRLASLGAARHLLVCSDYDGTLAPLAPRPELARLLPGAGDLLNRLARLPQTRVAIVSGRSRDNLRSHSGLGEPVLIIGSHGAELPGGGPGEAEAAAREQLDLLQSALAELCATSPGAWLERKPFGIAVHVREAAAGDAARVLAAVRGRLADWPAVKATDGKAVIELSLSRAGKGDAVRWLRNDWQAGAQVLFLGDDVTDEAAFAALGPGDVGIKVGAGPSAAEYRVESEQAALKVLDVLWRQRSAMGGEGLAGPEPGGPAA